MDRREQLDRIFQCVLNQREWRLLKASITVLKPIKDAMKVFEQESSPTINRVAETMYDVKETLSRIVSDKSVIKQQENLQDQ